MARRIHIAGLSARPRYSRDTRAQSTSRTQPSNPAPQAEDEFSVRLAGLKHDFTSEEFMIIAREAARAASEQEMELDMAGLLEAARDFRGELNEFAEPVEEPIELVGEAPLDLDDVQIHSPTSEDVLAED